MYFLMLVLLMGGEQGTFTIRTEQFPTELACVEKRGVLIGMALNESQPAVAALISGCAPSTEPMKFGLYFKKPPTPAQEKPDA